jgi:hypothetical protein
MTVVGADEKSVRRSAFLSVVVLGLTGVDKLHAWCNQPLAKAGLAGDGVHQGCPDGALASFPVGYESPVQFFCTYRGLSIRGPSGLVDQRMERHQRAKDRAATKLCQDQLI